MSSRTVVVTGLGVLSPVGRGPEATWQAATTGRSGVHVAEDGRPRARVDDAHVPGPVRLPDGRPHRGRATALAAVAAADALHDAALGGLPGVDLVVGTTMGEPSWIDTWPDAEAAEVPPPAERCRELFAGTPAALAADVADALGLDGTVSAAGGACAAGNLALAQALDEIRSGRSDCVLAGGVDAFSRAALVGFAKLGALAPDGCRPFGLDRQGLVLGEGAAFLVVESEEHARRRGAVAGTVLAGAGMSCDAHHPTSPRPDGAGVAQALRAALDDAGVDGAEVGWVSAHGTGTPANDRSEVAALRAVFGDAGPIASSVKSLTGHGLGAASAIEAVLAVLALRHSTAPGTWHAGALDPECAWDVAPDRCCPLPSPVVVNQAAAFGGCNVVTVFRQAPG